ncbi:MAG: ATP-binding protein [Candidatus Omnitrophica bacterium]|nr:ATP-binding protein [Candidatus Omnitrophota bacterium]
MIKESFFDRINYLELLEKRIKHLKDGYRQNVAITGDEMVGKTSIIFKLLNKFSDTAIIMIYLEVRPESANAFIKRFIGSLLYNFLSNSGIPIREDLDFLILKSRRYIPRTVEKIEAILAAVEKRKKGNNFSELLSLCDSIYSETGKSCVVIFDEFHHIESLGFDNLYRDWSRLLITQKNTLYIIISSARFKASSILSKNLALLFGNFEVINVEPFDTRSSEMYLEQRLSGIKIDKGLKNFIVNFTGGFPFYLEIICEALTKPTQEHLADILENMLFANSGALNQKFSSYIKRYLERPFGNDFISILHMIANGRNKIKDIAHILKKTRKDLAMRINHLLETDAINKNGDFLRINDRVFSFWLKFVYQEKSQSLTFNAENQKAKFRNNIEDMIEDFLMNAQKPLTQRLSEVLRLFEDESLQVERKKVRLNQFREIKQLEFSGSRQTALSAAPRIRSGSCALNANS